MLKEREAHTKIESRTGQCLKYAESSRMSKRIQKKKKKMYKLTQLDELTAVEKQRFNSYKAKKKKRIRIL